MSGAEARAWWADVEYMRERLERPRAERGESTAERDHAPVAARPRGAHRGSSGEADGFAPRRTVRIRGQAIPTVAAPRLRPVEAPALRDAAIVPVAGSSPAPAPASRRRRRPRPRPAERLGSHPDRMALWAVGMGLLLVVVAALSAHGL
jgi:hypothetical protein